MTIAMAKKAESLNLSSTLDTTLDQEEKGDDEMSAENLLANNDKLRYFIGQEEFEDGVQKWKEVRYYHYYFFIFLPPHLSQVLPEIKERDRERECERV